MNNPFKFISNFSFLLLYIIRNLKDYIVYTNICKFNLFKVIHKIIINILKIFIFMISSILICHQKFDWKKEAS